MSRLITRLLTVAEGVATDARGALTAVGLDPGTWVAPVLPASLAPFVVAIFEFEVGDPPPPGTQIRLRVQVVDPDGTALFVNEASQVIGVPANPELPMRISAVTQTPFMAAKSGRYEIIATVTLGADEVVGEPKASFIIADPESGHAG
jgi:hypothetical protein